MQFDQKTVDKIRGLMPLNMKKEISEELNVPYSSVRDAFNVVRTGTGKRKQNKKAKMYQLAVDKLAEKGIEI